MFLELLEEVEAGDAGPCEHDSVAPGQVVAQLLGHHAVELWLVLQRGQTVHPLTILQVDIDLDQEDRTGHHIKDHFKSINLL